MYHLPNSTLQNLSLVLLSYSCPSIGVPELPRQPKKWRKGQVNDWSAFDNYWANRLDQRNGAWTKMPGYSKVNRRTGQSKFYATVSNILIKIAPSELFNPSILWIKEKEKMIRALGDASVDEALDPNARARIAEEFQDDVDRIRNATRNKSLVYLLSEMRSIRSRFVLLVEILFLVKDQSKEAKALQDVDEMISSYQKELDGLRTADKARKADSREKPKTLKCDEGWKNVLKFVEAKRASCAAVVKNMAIKAKMSFDVDITQIRTSKRDLFAVVKKMQSLKTRLVLMVEMLSQAFEPRDAKGYRDELKPVRYENVYDILWAIEELLEKNPDLVGEFAEKLPPPKAFERNEAKYDRSLVYDDYPQVEKLIKRVQEKRRLEKDPIRLQLVDMFDKLPPLSKFSLGLKLDPWQKRVLAWIDAGRSTIICAPTSSGKTVLSSYAALPKGADALDDQGKDGADAKDAADKQAGGISKKKDDAREAVDGEEQELGEDEELSSGSDSEDDDDDDDEDGEIDDTDFSRTNAASARKDRRRRLRLLAEASNYKMNRVLFVVPTEPLVWQVGAYFSQLLHREGDRATKVAIVTDQLVYHPLTVYGLMPQIVVGTPMALETELTKCRGRVGAEDYYKKTRRDSIPGGFDHFDWVVYDEVHSLDGEEGQALQRLIRAMNCKFLALSATVGNAEQLRGWMESVKGEQLDVQTLTVKEDEVGPRVQQAEMPASFEKELSRLSIQPTAADKLLIHVEKTQECDQLLIDFLTPQSTVRDLKEAIAKNWQVRKDYMQDMEMTFEQLQIFRNDPMAGSAETDLSKKAVDLIENKLTLESYGFALGVAHLVKVYRNVNLVTHHGRFINLQRYVWNQPIDADKPGSLTTLSPLAAIESVSALENGILESSSLSFTSRDSYHLWIKLAEMFPADAIDDVNPAKFFRQGERITLQRTKDYEDAMKKKLRQLSTAYPNETQELLHFYALDDPESTELDLTELVLELKKREMTPCLPFHLNSFEAIKLFKSLLRGLELRQATAHPNFYTQQQAAEKDDEKASKNQVKSLGGNAKALEEAQRAGDIASTGTTKKVDYFEPHKDFTAGPRVPSIIDLERVAAEMESYDGFKPDRRAAAGSKLDSVRSHALMRGLRRGIGLFIKEVSFPAYRRAVMRLASKGELAVVISDDSLAFGVNMPFRTCIFCGEMYDREAQESRLTPLMAQQMSGRAGRRGLDQQGNLIYVGSRAKFVRSLMIGTVSHITGRLPNGQVIEPRYPSLLAQNILSQRYVGAGRAACVGGETLSEYVERFKKNLAIVNRSDHVRAPSLENSYLFNESRDLMTQLKFVDTEGGVSDRYVPESWPQGSMHHLSLLWSLRDFGHQGITLGMSLTDIWLHLEPTKHLVPSKKETDSDRAKMEDHKDRFFALLLVLIDRHPFVPKANNPEYPEEEQIIPAFQENTYFRQPDKKDLLEKWEMNFQALQEKLPANTKDPVVPGTLLDGTLFACLIDRNLCHGLSEDTKQSLKLRLWNVGQIVRYFHNCSWPFPEFYDVFTLILANCFQCIRYLNVELIQKIVDFENVTDVSYEKKEVKAVANKKAGTAGASASATGDSAAEACRDIWKDCAAPEEVSGKISTVAFTKAVLQVAGRSAALVAADQAERPIKWSAEQDEQLLAMLRIFKETALESLSFAQRNAQQKGDSALIKFIVDYKSAPAASEFKTYALRLGDACAKCSKGGSAQGSEQYTLGMLSWVLTQVHPTMQKNFSTALQLLYLEDVLTSEGIKEWYGADAKALSGYFPAGALESPEKAAEVVTALKGVKGLPELMSWLDEAEDGSDEESGEDGSDDE